MLPHRPLLLGLSVGHPSGTVGSIGPFVTLSGKPGFIAASFVLAPKGASIGDWIHQPGPYDAALLTGKTRVGKLSRVAEAVAGQTNHAAAAAVELVHTESNGNVIPPDCPEAGRRITEVADIHEIAPGDEVAFVGCTSGYSRGRVTTTSRRDLKVGELAFDAAFEVVAADGHFSEPGDGGALIYRCSDMKALGLVFARMNQPGNRSLSFGLPLRPALDALGAVLSA